MTGVSSPGSWRGGCSAPNGSLSGLSLKGVSCRLSTLSRGDPCDIFFVAFRIIELFVVLGTFEDSEMDDEELAALGTLPDVSTTDFDRSRLCFCRNLGNFEPCGELGGDDGDDECLDGLEELDIVAEEGVVAVVIVVAEEREADLDALESAALGLSSTFTVCIAFYIPTTSPFCASALPER